MKFLKAVMYLGFGMDYLHDQEYEDYLSKELDVGLPVTFTGQAGLKITSSYVPGLFMGFGFQFNFFSLMDDDYDKAMKKGFSVTAGYAF
jgi:hypothetical protein